MPKDGDGDAIAVPPPPPGLWESPSRKGKQQVQRRAGGKATKAGGAGMSPSTASGFGDGGCGGRCPPCTPTAMPTPQLSPSISFSVGGDEAYKQEQVQSMLFHFKTMRCKRDVSHDHRCCIFYHSERDRRRPVFTMDGDEWSNTSYHAYIAEPCNESFDDNKIVCSRGEACMFCHSTAELLYHPEFFRKRLCHQAMTTGCPRGRLCAFAHSRQELFAPYFSEQEEKEPTEEFIAWNFKTQWCPIGGPHDWETCMYAHTYRDWRRTPAIGYSSRPCPNWAQSVAHGATELMYELRCPNGMACPLAHGAKEQLYHPQFYKTSPCSDNCKRGALCAFTHGDRDRRGSPPGLNMNAEEAAWAASWPIPWALDLLACYQPAFCNPPRYHALEEQVPRKANKGGKGGSPQRSRGGGGGYGGRSPVSPCSPNSTGGSRSPASPCSPNSVGTPCKGTPAIIDTRSFGDASTASPGSPDAMPVFLDLQ